MATRNRVFLNLPQNLYSPGNVNRFGEAYALRLNLRASLRAP